MREVQQKPYRLAEVEPVPESRYDKSADEIVLRRNRLGGLFMRYAELASRGKSHLHRSVIQRSFEGLVNLVAVSLNLPAEDKQMLLELDDLADRCDCLIPALQQQLETLVIVRDFEHLKPSDPGRN